MNKTTLGKGFAVSTLAAAISLSAVVSAGVTDEDIMNDQATTHDVVSNGMGLRGQRYSSLMAVNPDTVKDLRPVWAFSFGGEKQRGQESQPVVKDGVMFVTGSYSRVFAIDVKTGDELWQYDARLVRQDKLALNKG